MDSVFKWGGFMLWAALAFWLASLAFDPQETTGTRAVAAAVFIAFQIRDEFRRQSIERAKLSEKMDRIWEKLTDREDAHFMSHED